MSEALVIIHERLGNWARQLRPRLANWPVRWSESRSAATLVRSARLSACPILVIDLGRQPVLGLEDLDQAMQATPSNLSVVLDPSDQPEVAWLARELGVTLVLGGVVVPPTLEALLHRWIPLAITRSESQGWSRRDEPEVIEFANPTHSTL